MKPALRCLEPTAPHARGSTPTASGRRSRSPFLGCDLNQASPQHRTSVPTRLQSWRRLVEAQPEQRGKCRRRSPQLYCHNTCNSVCNSLCNTCCYSLIHGHRGSCRNRLCNSVRNTRCDIVFHSDRFPVHLNETGGLLCLEPTARAHPVPSPTASWAALAFTVSGLKPQPSKPLSIGRVSRPAFSHGGAGSSARVSRPVSLRRSPMTRCSAARPHACSAAGPSCGRSTSGCAHCSYWWSAETSCAGASAATLVLGQWRR